jgi:hypothetical protein
MFNSEALESSVHGCLASCPRAEHHGAECETEQEGPGTRYKLQRQPPMLPTPVTLFFQQCPTTQISRIFQS